MNKNMNSFRIIQPMEGYNINALSYSSNSANLLVVGGKQAKILNRDGKEVLECMKGDMYIKDMLNTTGHV
jgi:hypothetical protein